MDISVPANFCTCMNLPAENLHYNVQHTHAPQAADFKEV